MALQAKMTDDLIRIGSAGGGLDFNAKSKMTEDLIRIASAVARGGGTAHFRGVGNKMTDDLIRIAAAGKGHVVLCD